MTAVRSDYNKTPLTVRKAVLWAAEVPTVPVENVNALAQLSKLAIRIIAGVAFVLASHLNPSVLRFQAMLVEVDRWQDFLLFFSSVRDLFQKDGWKVPHHWLFGAASISGALMFFHELSFIDLGKEAYQACYLTTCGLVFAGFVSLGVKRVIEAQNLFAKAKTVHVKILHVAKTIHAFVAATFYGALTTTVVPAEVTLPLGILAAGFGLGCILYETLGQKFGMIPNSNDIYSYGMDGAT